LRDFCIEEIQSHSRIPSLGRGITQAIQFSHQIGRLFGRSLGPNNFKFMPEIKGYFEIIAQAIKEL
jgi:hypothetical protein